MASSKPPAWTALLNRLRLEYAALPDRERDWLRAQINLIATAQTTLDQLFYRLGGPEACAACQGGCCGAGRHHLTLANLLGYLQSGQQPPAPDFSRSCPYLGAAGCLLPAANRPYNCISFFCEDLDARFTTEQRTVWAVCDQTLRAAYQAIADHYPAGSKFGFWLAVERLGATPLLTNPNHPTGLPIKQQRGA